MRTAFDNATAVMLTEKKVANEAVNIMNIDHYGVSLTDCKEETYMLRLSAVATTVSV